MAELLFWPALLAYGEAAVAYGAEARRPGRAGRLAIWGVRIGWLLQTALLALQAVGAGGFAWSTRAGALNLLAWLVVGAYLIWGCRPRFRLLGLAVMPVAAALLLVAHAGGQATDADGATSLLALHVALMLAALAGLTVAAGLSAFYLWHDRSLKRREAAILRLRVPPLESLDGLAARTANVSLCALTIGIGLGLVSLVRDGGTVDVAMAATVAGWAVLAAYVALRRFRGLHGRRAARPCLTAFVVAAAVLPVTHFA